MKILLTGAAGFIGYHTARRFLERGDHVFGLDNLNDYYPVSLKHDRLAELRTFERFEFQPGNVADRDLGAKLPQRALEAHAIVHLAAQAGVRYSIKDPYAYVESNVTGQVGMFELAAKLGQKPPIVYASSSSVYGSGEPAPFAETARADAPISVYAATKRAGELLAHAYHDIHGIAATGLRFFTVYGRFGRPDMAPWLFTDAILRGGPIQVFNDGQMQRDFTHVDDIVAGVVAATDRILAKPDETEPVYNLGNNNPVQLLDFIAAIEKAAGRKAVMEMKPKPAGDVELTFADITRAARDLDFQPRVPLEQGIADFVGWYRTYANL
jgi:UDP-glucuronate 4-epimerase